MTGPINCLAKLTACNVTQKKKKSTFKPKSFYYYRKDDNNVVLGLSHSFIITNMCKNMYKNVSLLRVTKSRSEDHISD